MSLASSQRAVILATSYALPRNRLSNTDLKRENPSLPIEKIFAQTGIASRPIASSDETASDLAYMAAEQLFETCPQFERSSVDLLVLCTQNPDYALPTSACLLQNRLKLSSRCAAFDISLGCSGYIYGLAIVRAMLENGLARRALFLTGDTMTKRLSATDMSVRVLFGDAGAATLLELSDQGGSIDPFILGTDGSGASSLIIHGSATRPLESDPLLKEIPEGHDPTKLFMDGMSIYLFTLNTVPELYRTLLEKASLTTEDIDWIVFHQANRFMLEQLRENCKIPPEKMVISVENTGNTTSCTIPIILTDLVQQGKLQSGMKVLLSGFGVGLSWGGCIVQWN